tara:strand:+ start:4081 stop:5241 length:1161 start_codon:yes stop_codon:yes gene_type:complete
MAVGDKWRFGVAAKIPNRKFRAPCLIYASVDGDHPISSSTLTIKNASNITESLSLFDASSMMMVADKIRVKPSTSTTTTESERLFVRSVSVGVITLQESTTVAFKDGDDVLITGHGMAEAWSNLNSVKALDDIRSGGDFDSYRLGFETDLTTQFSGITAVLPTDALPHVGVAYRLGFRYMLDNGKPVAVLLDDYTGSTIISNMLTGTSTSESNWTTQSYKSSAAASGSSTPTIKIFRHSSDNPKTEFNFALSEIWLQHAKGTSGESDGRVEMSIYPDEVSVSSEIHTATEYENVNTGKRYGFEPVYGAGATKLHTVTASYSSIPTATKADLKAMERWWKEGFLISLQPFLNGVPTTLFGRLSVSWPSNSWDESLSSAEVMFQEMVA